MKKSPKIISRKAVYKGFNAIDEIDLQPPSLRDGKEYAEPINREIVKTTDSVVVLIYVRSEDAFLFCEQFRTGPCFNEYNDDPHFILECVAGMIDAGHSPEQTALKEVKEETGVTLDHVEYFSSAYCSSGRMTEKTHQFYAEIDQIPKTGIFGNPYEGEEIRTHVIKREKAYDMVDNFEFYHAQTILALNWFRLKKDPAR